MTVRHAEVLEPDGSLHTLALRSAKATDIYTLADDTVIELEPVFTFHGFRYAEVETEARILEAPLRGHQQRYAGPWPVRVLGAATRAVA